MIVSQRVYIVINELIEEVTGGKELGSAHSSGKLKGDHLHQ